MKTPAPSDYYTAVFSDPLQLACYRERNRPCGSGPLNMMAQVYRLCDHIAKLSGWNLDDYSSQVGPEIGRQNKEWDRERDEKILRDQQESLDKARRNYFKKHKHAVGDTEAAASCLICEGNRARKLGKSRV